MELRLSQKNILHSEGQKLPTYDEFKKWDANQLSQYLVSQGIPIGDCLILHRIDGSIVECLTDKDYERLGFTAVGDMLRVKASIAKLQKQAIASKRDTVIWEGEKYMDLSCVARLFGCFACDEIPPDKYKLTGSNLQVTKFSRSNPNPCLACCYPTQRAVDNIALATVKDVDVNVQKPGCISGVCCCVKGRAEVVLSHMGADVDNAATTLYLAGDVGMSVQQIIRDAVADNTAKI